MNRLNRHLRTTVCALLVAGSAGCTSGRDTEAKEAKKAPQPEMLPSPSSSGASTPFLTTGAAGDAYLSWQQPSTSGNGTELRFSRLQADGWTPSQMIAQGEGWFVNWADFPSLAVLSQDRMAAHWLARSGKGTYAYNVHVSLSSDAGRTWSAPLTPHRDNTPTEHGFVSFIPWDADRLGLIWLDGREMSDEPGKNSGAMGLRYAEIGRAGQIGDSTLIDDRVCECCQTSAVKTARGAVAAFRNRSADEIRDIGISLFRDGGWTPTRIVSKDGWKIAGCPVNGPALDARGDQVALAWFTLAKDHPGVRLALSQDGGETFGDPINVNRQDSLGRVDVVLTPDGSAWVSRLEFAQEEDEQPRILISRFAADGRRLADIPLAQSQAARASGFPRMTALEDHIVLAWTQPGESAVRTARLAVD